MLAGVPILEKEEKKTGALRSAGSWVVRGWDSPGHPTEVFSAEIISKFR
jgi:hypothetical protein